MNHSNWTNLMAVPAGAPPSPPMMNAPMVPPAAPAKETHWMPIILGLVGGLIALVGAILPWLEMRSCAGALGIQICISVPFPFALGTLSPILGIAQVLALLFALVGVVMLFLQKPITGMLAGVMGVLTLLFAVLYLVTAPAYFSQLSGGVTGFVNITTGLGFGIYVTIIGALLLAVGGFMQWMKLKGGAAGKPSA